jgi:HAMP domain-containing protein
MPQTAGAAGSPFPPPPDFSSQPGQPAPSAAAQNGSPAAEGSSAAPTAPLNATGQPEAAENPGNGTAAGKAPPSPAQAPSRISVLLVLAGLVVLLAVGMLLRRAVEHALSRRRVIKLARQEPRLMEPAAVPPPMPTLVWQAPSVVPAHAQTQTEQRASEVEAALRKLAQNLRQRRPAANGAIGRTGAAVRTG